MGDSPDSQHNAIHIIVRELDHHVLSQFGELVREVLKQSPANCKDSILVFLDIPPDKVNDSLTRMGLGQRPGEGRESDLFWDPTNKIALEFRQGSGAQWEGASNFNIAWLPFPRLQESCSNETKTKSKRCITTLLPAPEFGLVLCHIGRYRASYRATCRYFRDAMHARVKLADRELQKLFAAYTSSEGDSMVCMRRLEPLEDKASGLNLQPSILDAAKRQYQMQVKGLDAAKRQYQMQVKGH